MTCDTSDEIDENVFVDDVISEKHPVVASPQPVT
jgi:hypothetical protein